MKNEDRQSTPGCAPRVDSAFRWWLLAILGVGAALRAIVIADYATNNPLAAAPRVDALTYWNWAGRIAAGQLWDGDPFFSAPLYPFLLSLLRRLGGGLVTLCVVQSAIDLLTAGLIARIGRTLARPAVGLLAAALFLLMIEPASFSFRALTSTLQLPLICFCWLALIGAQRAPQSLGRAAAAFAALGTAALAHPPMTLAVPLVAGWWWWRGGRDLRALGRTALAASPLLAIIGPATLHNYLASGGFFPVQAAVGINFRQGNMPESIGVITMIPGTSETREDLFRACEHLYESATGRPGTWSEIDGFFRRQVLDFWWENPLRTVRLFALKAYWYLSGVHYGDIYRPTLEIREGLTPWLRLFPLQTPWLLGLALVAAAVWLRRPMVNFPTLLLLLLPWVVVVAFWFSPRYRFPAIPVMAVGAAIVLVEGLRRGAPIRARAGLALGLALAAGPALLNRATGFDSPSTLLAEFRHAVGEACRQTGRAEQAVQWFRAALDAQPQHGGALAALGGALANLGRTEDAIRLLEPAVREQPDNAQLRDQLGQALAMSGRAEEALPHFEMAARLSPRNAAIRNNLGNAHRLAGDLDAAEREYRASIEIDPANASALYNLATVMMIRDAPRDAAPLYRAAISTSPDWLAPRLDLIAALAEMGDRAAAVVEIRAAIPLAERQAPELAAELRRRLGE